MPLFRDQTVTEVVTPDDIRQMTGIRADDFIFEEENIDINAALNEMLTIWIDRIASHVHARLGRDIAATDPEYEAIQDIVVRTVAKIVGVARQQRTSPVIQIGDFAVAVLNTSDVIRDLPMELKPFKKGRVSVFSSLEEYDETL